MSTFPDVPFSTTLYIRDHCLCLHLQRATRIVARRFDDALRPLDLTNGQFSLLISLNRPEPARLGSVASLLGMDRTTLTAALKALERRGLVKNTTDPEDRRGRLLTLTKAGKSLIAKALPIWTQTHREVEDLLRNEAPDVLRSDLIALAKTG
jgi:DNA-binding MarR family transcriptional regulator